jgi:hypothetical protein
MQPVETTLYSLSDEPPMPSSDSDRREGERHMTLYRVGSILVDDRRELCLIKNISAGGMMIRLYCSVAAATPVVVELKSGQPIRGKISWTRDQNAGVSFDDRVDVIDILSSSMDGPRPRLPRIETNCFATVREGANVLRVETCDISQGGMKIRTDAVLAPGCDVVVTLPELAAQPGIICWSSNGYAGINFNRLMPLGDLVAWLNVQRDLQRTAG